MLLITAILSDIIRSSPTPLLPNCLFLNCVTAADAISECGQPQHNRHERTASGETPQGASLSVDFMIPRIVRRINVDCSAKVRKSVYGDLEGCPSRVRQMIKLVVGPWHGRSKRFGHYKMFAVPRAGDETPIFE